MIGRSHELSQTRCQDANRVVVVPRPDGEAVVVAVADGAGSAVYSHIGALTASASATELIAERLLARGSAEIDGDDVARILFLVRDAVVAEGHEREQEPREFASTLLLLVLLPDRTFAAHIGDGAIVVDDGTLRVLSWPEQGEYANVTVFLTTEDAVENARIYATGPVTRFALFSDGLQSIALDYATQTVFAPFVESMLKPLATPDANDLQLQAALEAYLNSATINNRTDDDKTLVLGVRSD